VILRNIKDLLRRDIWKLPDAPSRGNCEITYSKDQSILMNHWESSKEVEIATFKKSQ
jgi:hypothetical protein